MNINPNHSTSFNYLSVKKLARHDRNPLIDQSEKFKNYFNSQFNGSAFRESLPDHLKRTGGRNQVALHILDTIFGIKGLNATFRARFTLYNLGTLLLKMGIEKDKADAFITIARAHQMGSDNLLTTQKLDISLPLKSQKDRLFFSCDPQNTPFLIEKIDDIYYKVSNNLRKKILLPERQQIIKGNIPVFNSTPVQTVQKPKSTLHPNPVRFLLHNPAPYGPKKSPIKNPIYIGRIPDNLKILDQQALISDSIWGYIFSIINTQTANTPYAVDDKHFIPINGKTVYRPNHNGTHSARQVRLLKELLKLTELHHTAFTAEQKNSLILAAYCYRLGRVDESGAGHDQNRLRSAQVYRAYATQLNFSREIIDWTFQIISRDYSTPLPDQTQELAYTLLDTAHRLDLQRCYSDLSHEIPAIKRNLDTLCPSGTSSTALATRLMAFSEKLIRATGCKNAYKRNRHYNPDLFGPMSLDGKKCIDTLNKISFN